MNDLSPTYQQHPLRLRRSEPVVEAVRPERGDRAHVRLLCGFAVTLVALNLSLLLLPVWLMRTDWYQIWPAYSYHLNVDYHIARAGEHSDVMVLGDSAAMMAVKPSAIEAASGLKVANLTMFAFAGFRSFQLLADHYLARNDKPRMAVIALYPESFGIVEAADHGGYRYEGAYAGYRLDAPWRVLLRMARSPEAIAATYEHLGRGLKQFAWSVVAGGKGEAIRAWAAGMRAYAVAENGGSTMRLRSVGWEPPRLAEDCGFTRTNEVRLAGVEALRRHLEERGIPTLVYVLPVPACDRSVPHYREALAGVTANLLTRRPNREYHDYAHMTEEGGRAFSGEFAGFLRERFDRITAP
jgi:hypothetical protein